jgi:hypothetical protein
MCIKISIYVVYDDNDVHFNNCNERCSKIHIPIDGSAAGSTGVSVSLVGCASCVAGLTPLVVLALALVTLEVLAAGVVVAVLGTLCAVSAVGRTVPGGGAVPSGGDHWL